MALRVEGQGQMYSTFKGLQHVSSPHYFFLQNISYPGK